MKNLITLLFLFTLAISSKAATSFANNDAISTNTTNTTGAVSSNETTRIINRVNAIKAMDKKNLSNTERTNLKQELRDMKKSLSGPGSGVYVSGTALILIIILLIILL